jgi:hypothetical protein
MEETIYSNKTGDIANYKHFNTFAFLLPLLPKKLGLNICAIMPDLQFIFFSGSH